ncbi:MAG: hypothetical protein ABEJ78_03780 [Haloferacaceae archaeon]
MESNTGETVDDANRVPWPQELLDSIWLLAGGAILFWVLSYVVWGLVDLLTVPSG